MIETPDVGTTATTVTTVTTAAAAAPSNEEEEEDNSAPSEAADVIVVVADHDEQHSNNEDDTEREIKLLQESQGWWFPKTKLSAWVSLRQLRVRSRQSTIFVAAASFIAVPQDK